MKQQRGFTLVELVVVMLVIAILGGLAVNSYKNYVLKSNRSYAWSALLQIQTGEEKFFLQNGTYTTSITAAPPGGLGINTTTAANYYTVTVGPDPGVTPSVIGTSYLATATAIGTQLNDLAACQTYTVNTQGTRTPADSTGCW
jgi:type IV pilus assembly protein PilE